MTALAKQQEAPVVAVSDSATILQIISRAASDPTVDIDKMERLMAMHERGVARNAKAAYAEALARMQPKLPIISERGQILNRDGKVQSTYAKWEDINEAISPILAEHGFSLSFRPGNEGEKIKATGILAHREGHSEEATFVLPSDASGSKNAVQAAASSLSYCKRYVANGLLNLTSRGEDDDGRKAGSPPTLSEQQVADLEALLTEVGANKQAFLKWAKCDSLSEILACNYSSCVKAIEAKRR